jgi:hypothetical protein
LSEALWQRGQHTRSTKVKEESVGEAAAQLGQNVFGDKVSLLLAKYEK